jgi:hypothetical protein
MCFTENGGDYSTIQLVLGFGITVLHILVILHLNRMFQLEWLNAQSAETFEHRDWQKSNFEMLQPAVLHVESKKKIEFYQLRDGSGLRLINQN